MNFTMRLLPLCSLALSLVSAPAQAGIAIADDFYEETVSLSCPIGSYLCRINFTKTPTGKVLIVKRIACFHVRTQKIEFAYLGVSMTSGGSASRKIPIPFLVNTTGDGLYYYTFNEEVEFRIGPNRFPFYYLETSYPGSGNSNCALTGTLQPQ